jgi:hypothetical protein
MFPVNPGILGMLPEEGSDLGEAAGSSNGMPLQSRGEPGLASASRRC